MQSDRSESGPVGPKQGLGHLQGKLIKPDFSKECARQARLTQQADREDVGLGDILESLRADWANGTD